MRIVHVTSYQVPGFGYEELMLAREQVRMGHSVWIVTSNYLHPMGEYAVLKARFPERQVAPRKEVIDGVTIFRQDSFQIHNRVWIRGLRSVVASLFPDIVHCHNLLQFHPGRLAIARTRSGVHAFALLVDDHTLYSVKRKGLVADAFYSLYRTVVHRFIAQGVDTFTAAAEECKQFLVNECGVAGMPEVVPLGVDPELFRPDATRRSAERCQLGLAPDTMVVMYTGKVIPAKEIDVLIRAIAELRASVPNAFCLVVGDAQPEYSRMLTAQIDRLGLKLHVRMQGSVSQVELAGLYSAADVAVWPGSESLAILEAMASGLPVVVSDQSAYAGLVEKGPGLTFAAHDPGVLAATLKQLEDGARRLTMGQTGRDVVKRTRTWRVSAESYARIYMRSMRSSGVWPERP